MAPLPPLIDGLFNSTTFVMEKEIWKDVVGYEGHYEVSNKGRVKSIQRKVSNGKSYRIVNERILKLHHRIGKYVTVRLAKAPNIKTHSVHRLVAEAFIPNPYNKPQVNHKNGNKHDNRIQNLHWATEQENSMHAYVNGFTKKPRTMKGEAHGMSKVTRNDVLQIRSVYEQGWATYKELGNAYGMTDVAIRFIVIGKNWSHV